MNNTIADAGRPPTDLAAEDPELLGDYIPKAESSVALRRKQLEIALSRIPHQIFEHADADVIAKRAVGCLADGQDSLGYATVIERFINLQREDGRDRITRSILEALFPSSADSREERDQASSEHSFSFDSQQNERQGTPFVVRIPKNVTMEYFTTVMLGQDLKEKTSDSIQRRSIQGSGQEIFVYIGDSEVTIGRHKVAATEFWQIVSEQGWYAAEVASTD